MAMIVLMFPSPARAASRRLFLILALALAFGFRPVTAQQPAKPAAPTLPPTHANVQYGPHERNVLDFWKAESEQPTPVLVFIHGGGFVAGDKRGVVPEA